MNERKMFFKGLMAGLLSAAIIIVAVFSFKVFVVDSNKSDVSAILDKAVVIQEIIDEYYLEDSDVQALADAMYKGMIEGLGDKYSRYYTAEEYKELMESVSGTYKGIGVSVIQDEEGKTIVKEVFDKSPSADAGMLPGDILYLVDGTDITGMDLTDIVGMIKGEEGTTVDVTIVRSGSEVEYTLERRQVEIPTTYSELLDGNVGYLVIASFDTVTAEQFKGEIASLKEQGMTSLIIDIRDNPGGTLDSVTNILDQLLPEGLTLYTLDKQGTREEYFSDEENKLELPMVVLTNANSASASEIFAGAMKDFGVATIVGETTYGKGVMQAIRTLSDGSAIKITTASFYTPKGVTINGIGIIPDVEVIIPEEAFADYVITKEEDVQLKKAIEILQ